jgi:hypothetical protein
VQHEQIQADLRSGRIGLAQNRLPATSRIEDVAPATSGRHRGLPARYRESGMQALADGHGGRSHARGRRRQPLDQRRGRGQSAASVLENRRPAPQLHRSAPGEEPPHQPIAGTPLPHVVTTSYLTHDAIADWQLAAAGNYGYPGPLLLSPGRNIGLRLVPMVRDLRFAWEEMPQQFSTSRRRRCAKACTRA